MRDTGMMYLLAIGEHAEILDENLRNPYFSALETSQDGKLGYMRLPAELSRLTIPAGTAVRVPAMLGCRLAQGPRWRVLTSEEFYSRGYAQPDPYALEEEVQELTAEVAALIKSGVPSSPEAPKPATKKSPAKTSE